MFKDVRLMLSRDGVSAEAVDQLAAVPEARCVLKHLARLARERPRTEKAQRQLRTGLGALAAAVRVGQRLAERERRHDDSGERRRGFKSNVFLLWFIRVMELGNRVWGLSRSDLFVLASACLTRLGKGNLTGHALECRCSRHQARFRDYLRSGRPSARFLRQSLDLIAVVGLEEGIEVLNRLFDAAEHGNLEDVAEGILRKHTKPPSEKAARPSE